MAAFAAAMLGLILVFDATWATIALCVLALGIQAYRRAKLHPEDGDRIAVAVGTFVSAAIGGVLVLVDKLWLAIPITAAALGIDGLIRARREAKRTSGGRVAFRAVAEAIPGNGGPRWQGDAWLQGTAAARLPAVVRRARRRSRLRLPDPAKLGRRRSRDHVPRTVQHSPSRPVDGLTRFAIMPIRDEPARR